MFRRDSDFPITVIIQTPLAQIAERSQFINLGEYHQLRKDSLYRHLYILLTALHFPLFPGSHMIFIPTKLFVRKGRRDSTPQEDQTAV